MYRQDTEGVYVNVQQSSINQVSVDVVCFVQFSEEEEDLLFPITVEMHDCCKKMQ